MLRTNRRYGKPCVRDAAARGKWDDPGLASRTWTKGGKDKNFNRRNAREAIGRRRQRRVEASGARRSKGDQRGGLQPESRLVMWRTAMRGRRRKEKRWAP